MSDFIRVRVVCSEKHDASYERESIMDPVPQEYAEKVNAWNDEPARLVYSEAWLRKSEIESVLDDGYGSCLVHMKTNDTFRVVAGAEEVVREL